MQDKIKELIGRIQQKDFRALARSITIVENELNGYKELLHKLRHIPDARVVGVTGPPGAGKSTLVNALLNKWIDNGLNIAVIAVDPSSPFNFGAILGDRIRMSDFYNNEKVFIRSLASRGALGGLHPKIIEITDVVKQGGFDYILVETVGVGQSEVEVAGLADCTVVTLVPEAGDEVQTIKAGIMEIADIFVLNKADREMADRMYRNLKIMVHEKADGNREIPVVKTVATEGTGVNELTDTIDRYFETQHTRSEKRVQLLTEKSWQLIQNERMKRIDRKQLRAAISKALSEEDFNLYSFTQGFLDGVK